MWCLRSSSFTREGGLSRVFSATVLIVAFLGAPSRASANGAAFFRPAGKDAKVDLVYVGTIKDSAGRKLNFADVTVNDKNLGLTFPFANDAPGHFRSPDVGSLIKEVGQFVDPPNLEITCFVVGYKVATRSVPRKSHGILEVDFVMADDPAASVRTAPEPPRQSMEGTAALGCGALFVIAAAVRAAGRRRSTND